MKELSYNRALTKTALFFERTFMSYKFWIPLIFSAAFLTACETTETTTSPRFSQPVQEPIVQTAQTSTQESDKQLIVQNCKMQPQQCNCFADQLIATLNPEQWIILRAALNQEDEPPAGISEQKLQSLNEKMTQAMQSCSR